MLSWTKSYPWFWVWVSAGLVSLPVLSSPPTQALEYCAGLIYLLQQRVKGRTTSFLLLWLALQQLHHQGLLHCIAQVWYRDHSPKHYSCERQRQFSHPYDPRVSFLHLSQVLTSQGWRVGVGGGHLSSVHDATCQMNNGDRPSCTAHNIRTELPTPRT